MNKWSNDKSIDELKKDRDKLRFAMIVEMLLSIPLIIFPFILSLFTSIYVIQLYVSGTMGIICFVSGIGSLVKWECRTIIITIKEQEKK